MELSFEYQLDGGGGLSPQVVHTPDNLFRLIVLNSQGIVESKIADPILGLYHDLDFKSIGQVSPDEPVSHVSLKKVAHFGAYGFWSAEGDHRFVMFMLPTDISHAFVDGTIKVGVSNEISQLSASLLNIKGELLTRTRSLVTPGTKMEVFFSLGNSDEIHLGSFYLDRSSMHTPDEKININARNSIGKLLKEQTFDEHTTFEHPSLQQNLQAILELAGVEGSFIGDPLKPWKLRFDSEVTYLNGIKQVLALLDGWKLGETTHGGIGIARGSDPRFIQPGVFVFERDKTCWSYNIEYDDSEATSRICVTCDEPANRVFAQVPRNKWWIQPSHRTLYVDVADGATLSEMNDLAVEVAQIVARSGRQESFVGIFCPQLSLGDEVHLLTHSKTEVIGTVVDVTHTFGRSGFYTSFTVDSGGRKGKARLSDLIGQVSNYTPSKGVTIY